MMTKLLEQNKELKVFMKRFVTQE